MNVTSGGKKLRADSSDYSLHVAGHATLGLRAAQPCARALQRGSLWQIQKLQINFPYQLDFYFSCDDGRRLEQEKIIVFLNTGQILKRRTRGKLLLFGIAALYNVHSFLESREILRQSFNFVGLTQSSR